MLRIRSLLQGSLRSSPLRFKRSSITKESCPSFTRRLMDEEKVSFPGIKKTTTRMHIVSSFSTELLEMHAEEPSLHILFIPGNPGVVSFYKDFIEAVYVSLEGNASITAIGHISHTEKDWEHGRMFSLQEQIDHKLDFIKQECTSSEVPVVLVGHSIGSYICLEIFKRLPQQVNFFVGLFPFLSLNLDSSKQSKIRKISRSSILCASISSFASLLGLFPRCVANALMRSLLGQSYSTTAVDAVCSHLMKYHTIRNILFMAMTEFTQLSGGPDWTFMNEKKNQIAFLFGIDDHWGPLSFFEEISRKVSGLSLSVEREGHMHAFCCTEAGSICVAQHVATLIKSKNPK